jgi:small subunit ribosomal protein S9
MCLTDFKTKIPFSATGRRKSSVANVTLVPGSGLSIVNHQPSELYFKLNQECIALIKIPLQFLGLDNVYDIYATVHGGGLKGQAAAIKLAVARVLYSTILKSQAALKHKGLLTRDARRKERKKFGLKKARKAPQFSKR